MSEYPAIEVNGLGKQYVLGGAEKGDEDFRDMLAGALLAPFRRLKRLQGSSADQESFWALKDVGFSVDVGDAVAIVGGNGAGKSTLLKVLSRITDPTEGSVKIRGRVSSLLEVGTGFHPDLTGRENIFLNGAILGMSRHEIRSKFDEIVAFADVERFLDTPVKRYSSGMYVRLAFAVAAHLEPEILVVDEVLAVGDAAFQRKCLGKMKDVGQQGRTVLFVSHNMSAVSNLCRRAILLQQGSVVMDDLVEKVIPFYMGIDSPRMVEYRSEVSRPEPHVRSLRISQADAESSVFRIDKPLRLLFEIEACGQEGLEVAVKISNVEGVCVQHSCSSFLRDISLDGVAELACTVPAYGLAAGKYSVEFRLFKKHYQGYDINEKALVFEVGFSGVLADRTVPYSWKAVCGPGLLQWN